MEFEISLEDLRFYAYHGVFDDEREVGNEFRVSLSVFLPVMKDAGNDLLDSTVSYADLFDIVSREMKKPRKLLETVALDTANRIKEKFESISRGFIKIEKLHPPIPEMLGKASVTLHF